MKVVYIAGKFRAPTHWGVVENVRRAEAVALDVWSLGAAALCPHLNTANFDGALPDEAWLSGTMALMERCDAVMLVPGWLDSEGARAERTRALALGLPVFDDLQKLAEWLAWTAAAPGEPQGSAT